MRRKGRSIEKQKRRAANKEVRDNRRTDRLGGAERPEKEPHQFYVSGGKPGKKARHKRWCDAMNGAWLSGSNSIRVVDEEEAMRRRSCQLCEAMVEAEAAEVANAAEQDEHFRRFV